MGVSRLWSSMVSSRNPVHLQGKEELVCSLAFPEGKLVSLSQTAFDTVVSLPRQTSLFSNRLHRIGAVSGFWDEVDAL